MTTTIEKGLTLPEKNHQQTMNGAEDLERPLNQSSICF